MPNKTHRPVVLLVAVLGLLGFSYWAYQAFRVPSGPQAPAGVATARPASGPPSGPPGAMAVAVETIRLSTSDLALDTSAVGSLRSNESVVLRPEVAGRISAIHFRDGSSVTKGTLLVQLDASTQSAEFDQARANLGLSQTSLKRTRELFEKKFVSQQALDNAEAGLKVQEAALALAQARLEKTRIKAPFSGRVGLRTVSAGDYVKEGQDLINLEDISVLKIDFRLPETFLGSLRTGQVLEVSTDALPGHKFEAAIDAINPLVEAAGRAISCRAQLSNADGRLRPGMFVRVRLIFEQRSGVLMVPEQAIVPDARSPYVYRVVEGKAVRVPVKTGLRRAAQVEVPEGLNAGDEIVIAGQMKLRDGVPVRPVVTAGGGGPPAGAAEASGKPGEIGGAPGGTAK